ncbi:hypothetical protein Tco_0278057 [Tanacetum coccineum]
MDTLSLVSKYLNGMEDILDDGDSMEARKLTVEKSKKELVEKSMEKSMFTFHDQLDSCNWIDIMCVESDRTP